MDSTNTNSGLVISYNEIFFCAYAILFLTYMIYCARLNTWLGDEAVESLGKYTYIIFLIICTFSFLLRRYNIYNLIGTTILILVGILTYIYSGEHEFFDLILLIVIAQDIDFQLFLKRALRWQCLIVCFVVILSLVGIIDSWSEVRAYNGVYRVSLGFSHPNMIGMLVFQIIAELIWIYRNNRIFTYALSIGLGLIQFYFTNSQSSIIAIFLIVICNVLYDLFLTSKLTIEQIKKFVLIALIIGFILVGCLVRYYWIYPEELFSTTLAKRITLSQSYLAAYDVKLFGQSIENGTWVQLPGTSLGYYYLDNAFLTLLLHFGLAATIVFTFLQAKMIKDVVRKSDIRMLFTIAVYLIYSLTENTFYLAAFNFTLIYACVCIYQPVYSEEIQDEYIS
ncbi:MAG: hypothetical protein LUH43_04350 [Clostridia bacterium]|nr:hypothetical protein [Clostridia bacterium]